MRRLPACAFLLLTLLAFPVRADCVILLHGLARTSAAMDKLATAFADHGHTVANIDYPSRAQPVEQLAPLAVEAGVEICASAAPIHFVTHSLGSILVRHYLANHALPQLGRVVMIAPPNQGSEVVDRLRNLPGFAFWNGPAGLQLGTGPDDLPRSLPPVTYPVGVIAGTRTFNLLLSQFLPNPDDGKVSAASARVEGMTAFITVPYSHPIIMERDEVVALALRFITTESFGN